MLADWHLHLPRQLIVCLVRSLSADVAGKLLGLGLLGIRLALTSTWMHEAWLGDLGAEEPDQIEGQSETLQLLSFRLRVGLPEFSTSASIDWISVFPRPPLSTLEV